jgi:hypothetical protein
VLRVQPRWVPVARLARVALPAARVTPATATPTVWPIWQLTDLAATMRPYTDLLRRLDVEMIEALEDSQ